MSELSRISLTVQSPYFGLAPMELSQVTLAEQFIFDIQLELDRISTCGTLEDIRDLYLEKVTFKSIVQPLIIELQTIDRIPSLTNISFSNIEVEHPSEGGTVSGTYNAGTGIITINQYFSEARPDQIIVQARLTGLAGDHAIDKIVTFAADLNKYPMRLSSDLRTLTLRLVQTS